jgi:outer membrane assembly lipoprotein YfiO
MKDPGKNLKPFLPVISLLLSFALVFPPSGLAYWVWSPEAGKFVNAEGTVEGPAEEQFKYALRFLDEGKPEKAMEELENLVKRYPNAKIVADALFQLGVLQEKSSDNYKAFKTYRKIMETYPQSPRMDEVVERTYAIGNLFLSGEKPRVMGMAILPAVPKAVEVFKAISENAPFSAYGDRATFNLGIAYKKTHQYEEALQTFQRLSDDYPNSELVSDARFQLADTAFQMSIRKTDRDLLALDTAEKSAEEFMKEYPDSHISPKAMELVKAINEKNAEKNYKIGLYYDRENYIDSAVIYYESVVKKYPGTVWAMKSNERLGQLKDPGKFMKAREEELQARLKVLEEKEIAVRSQIESFKIQSDKESQMIAERERERLEGERKRLEKEWNSLSRSKAQSVRTRAKVLRIKEAELKEKWKNLKEKKKYYKKRMTDDLVKAFTRWEESLKAEEYALAREKADLQALGDAWGVRTGFFIPLPFQKKRGVAPAIQYKSKNIEGLEKLQTELALKEALLKERRAVALETLEQLDQRLAGTYWKDSGLSAVVENSGGDLKALQGQLKEEQAKLDDLSYRIKLAEKGKPRTMPFQGTMQSIAKAASVPVAAAGKSIGWMGSAMPKIKFDKTWTPEKLESKRTELKEKVAELKEKIATAQEALKTEKAEDQTPEVKKPAPPIDPAPANPPQVNARMLSKEIRQLHREIRMRYEDVEDRKKRKDLLIKKLSQEVEEVKQSVSLFEKGKAALKPVSGPAYLMKAFVFGLPDKEKETIKSADNLEKGLSAEQVSRVSELKEEIEYETIMIDKRREEILRFEDELKEKEALATAAKIPLKDLTAVRPDYILKTNFERLGKTISPKTREEILMNRLDKFSAELSEVVTELEAVEKALQTEEAKSPEAAAPQPPPEAVKQEAEPAPQVQPEKPAPVPAEVIEDLSELRKQYKAQRKQYEETKDRFDSLLKTELKQTGKSDVLKRWEEEKGMIEKDRKQLIEERNKIEADLSGAYHQEAETIENIRKLLREKIAKLDDTMKSLRFKSGKQAEQLSEEEKALQADLEKWGIRMKALKEEETRILEPLEALHA